MSVLFFLKTLRFLVDSLVLPVNFCKWALDPTCLFYSAAYWKGARNVGLGSPILLI